MSVVCHWKMQLAVPACVLEMNWLHYYMGHSAHPSPRQELCCQYWPSVVGEAKQFGSLTVELTSEDNPCTEYVVRKLRVWQENKQEEGRLVTQLHFLKWPEGGCPDSATPVVELVNDLQRIQRQSGNRPITVHCSDGVGRTGTFCALVTALERVKTEQIVDVFRTIRTHRIQRSGMVANLVSAWDSRIIVLCSLTGHSVRSPPPPPQTHRASTSLCTKL